MEAMLKKFQQKFRKVRDEMSRWDELQLKLVSQFRNASSIIERLQVIQDTKNYGNLSCVEGIRDAIVGKQIISLESILLSTRKTLEDFHGVVLSLEKILQDGRQLFMGLPLQFRSKQLQERVGVKPTFSDCLDGLKLLQEMHFSEYLLKASLVSVLSTVTLKPSVSSGSDLAALQQILVDQPNIARDEVQHIFDIIFAEEI